MIRKRRNQKEIPTPKIVMGNIKLTIRYLYYENISTNQSHHDNDVLQTFAVYIWEVGSGKCSTIYCQSYFLNIICKDNDEKRFYRIKPLYFNYL